MRLEHLDFYTNPVVAMFGDPSTGGADTGSLIYPAVMSRFVNIEGEQVLIFEEIRIFSIGSPAFLA